MILTGDATSMAEMTHTIVPPPKTNLNVLQHALVEKYEKVIFSHSLRKRSTNLAGSLESTLKVRKNNIVKINFLAVYIT